MCYPNHKYLFTNGLTERTEFTRTFHHSVNQIVFVVDHRPSFNGRVRRLFSVANHRKNYSVIDVLSERYYKDKVQTQVTRRATTKRTQWENQEKQKKSFYDGRRMSLKLNCVIPSSEPRLEYPHEPANHSHH
jgi:hypothetical protein